MKHLLSLLLCVFFSITATKAQQLENSTLWEISGNGLEKPSYLFGTIHITCDASLDSDIKKALDATTQLVLELDMDDPTMQSKMMGGMYMKDGKTLKDYVSDEEFSAIDSLFTNQAGMSINMMQNIKPFFLTSMLYPKMMDCPMESFELELMKATKEQNEEVYGLETIEDQLQVFETIPYEDQVADLIRMAKDNLAYDKATFAKMFKIYEEENITAMLDMMDDENNKTTAKHQDILLKNRNINWIPRIEEYAKAQPTFFGVGAGHLAGEYGVIKLLRKAGFTVLAVQ
ncbi:TraB/GumN family protein [Flavobacteriaceae bacterium S0825]|uniref:TraB/GumN family protein n=1 Tax=Gaetbulibacter sp. S0825 TaxID=2720084 RepID=UPI001431282D|nr:TraB/GumN family protein [Gaetbulibacter sp. S0825]MCK0109213.1 TraB/GumN family protein [Flavobacteriaceae bacterium S0825]NIX64848.1 TraB/GumN family protein [Gaetbulibacter sp. S0825]